MLLEHPCNEPTAIHTQLGAIFVSLDLSRSTWLITSISPGKGEKMSRHSVAAGDIAALLARFAELKRKAAMGAGAAGAEQSRTRAMANLCCGCFWPTSAASRGYARW